MQPLKKLPFLAVMGMGMFSIHNHPSFSQTSQQVDHLVLAAFARKIASICLTSACGRLILEN